MTGRWTHMNGSSAAWNRTRMSGLCLATSVLCAVGLLCGVVLRTSGHVQHRHSSVSAAVIVADSQTIPGRGDVSAVAPATTPTTAVRLAAVSVAESSASADQSEPTVVRTRGPPASAA